MAMGGGVEWGGACKNYEEGSLGGKVNLRLVGNLPEGRNNLI